MSVSVDGPRVPSRCAAAVRRITRATLALDGVGVGEIGVRLTDDAELRALNRAWRGLDRVTDVLSFPYETSPPRRIARADPRARDDARAPRRGRRAPPAPGPARRGERRHRDLDGPRARPGEALPRRPRARAGAARRPRHAPSRRARSSSPGRAPDDARAREREALRGAVASIAELERRLALRRPARTRPRRRRRATAAVT